MNIETCPECGVYCEPIDVEAFPKILLWKCPKCGAKYELRTAFRRVPETRADRIRAMTDEGLAMFLDDVQKYNICCKPIIADDCGDCMTDLCWRCWLDWLRQEVEA